VVQAVHWWLAVQRSPAGQSAAAQQLPVTQAPPQQTLPAPHWALVEQAAQVLSTQNWPPLHWLSPQQLPALPAPPQQTFPAPGPPGAEGTPGIIEHGSACVVSYFCNYRI
jgi:hypothetical protein